MTAIAFEHSLADALPGLYVEHPPTGFPGATCLERNPALEARLGLSGLTGREAAQLYSGSTLPPSARPIALAYAGHQFGHLSPQLGDGRAVLLGELRDDAGRRIDVQLKGSGRTPFSRGGDGKATLGPALRELLLSEALAHLGVATTEVLAVVTTGEPVRRETFLPGAVVARVAASHLRVGTLEFLALRKDTALMRDVVNYALQRHYPARVDDKNPALALLEEVAKAQARLIARWMHVGFIHGVMNTDNVTLSGETIDYGPCAFMDTYDPATVFSSIDRNRRYAFGQQPHIGLWNTLRLAEALLPLLHDDEAEAITIAQGSGDLFRTAFNDHFLGGMRAKIGLDEERDGDTALVSDLVDWMHAGRYDYTMTFRDLARTLRGEASRLDDDEAAQTWHGAWRKRLGDEAFAAVAARMDAVNPIYIPRNHIVEEALAAAHEEEMAPFRKLRDVLARPFTERPGLSRYAQPAPADFGPYRTFCGT